MGLEYSSNVGYGFYLKSESDRDLMERLSLGFEYIHDLSESLVTEALGSPLLYAGSSQGDDSIWYVFAKSTFSSVDARFDLGVRDLLEPTEEELRALEEARKRCFDDSEDLPRIGWFLSSEVY